MKYLEFLSVCASHIIFWSAIHVARRVDEPDVECEGLDSAKQLPTSEGIKFYLIVS